MSATKNSLKRSSTAVNAAEIKAMTKRELSSTTLVSNGTAKLTSLTPARDLTLGGRGGAVTNKKVFLPNLNVVRNKNTNVKTSKDTTVTRGRGRGRGGRDGGRGGRGGSTLIQTTGVFSEGAGATNIRPTSRSTYSRAEDDAPSTLTKPTVKKSIQKLDLKVAFSDDTDFLTSLDADDKDEAVEKTDLDRMPVQLNQDAVAIASRIQALHVAEQIEQKNKPIPCYPESVTQLLDNTQQQIFLMQFPDTLPLVEEDSESQECSTNPSTSSAADTAKRTNSDSKKEPITNSVLSKMEEGQVGRLIRYKSGKTKLILGKTYFDLEMGIKCGFLQDLMSISCNRDERNGNMINLGPIEAKITATPDWEHLLNQESSSDQTL